MPVLHLITMGRLSQLLGLSLRLSTNLEWFSHAHTHPQFKNRVAFIVQKKRRWKTIKEKSGQRKLFRLMFVCCPQHKHQFTFTGRPSFACEFTSHWCLRSSLHSFNLAWYHAWYLNSYLILLLIFTHTQQKSHHDFIQLFVEQTTPDSITQGNAKRAAKLYDDGWCCKFDEKFTFTFSRCELLIITYVFL